MTRCSHCRKRAVVHWTLTLCADGSRKRLMHLCGDCDALLNEIVLEFGRVRGRVAMMRDYRREQSA